MGALPAAAKNFCGFPAGALPAAAKEPLQRSAGALPAAAKKRGVSDAAKMKHNSVA